MTLIEILVALTVLGVALAMFGATLFIMQKSQIRFGEYSRANDEVHIAITDLDRELRSGYVANTSIPSWSGGVNATIPSGNTVVIYTEDRGSAECVRWVLYPDAGQQTLYRVAWNPLSGGPHDGPPLTFDANGRRVGLARSYREVAYHIVNGTSRPNPAFEWVTSTTSIGGLAVSLWVNVPGRGGTTRDAQEIQVKTLITPRNALRSPQPPVSSATGSRSSAC